MSKCKVVPAVGKVRCVISRNEPVSSVEVRADMYAMVVAVVLKLSSECALW